MLASTSTTEELPPEMAPTPPVVSITPLTGSPKVVSIPFKIRDSADLAGLSLPVNLSQVPTLSQLAS